MRRLGKPSGRLRAMRVLLLVCLMVCAPLPLRADPAQAGTRVPLWLYPLNPPAAKTAAIDPAQRLRLAGSDQTFTPAELNDAFFAPDWQPQSHAPMPPIVARGRPPEVMACGYCHLPAGQGRPENAPLAGLPAAYIEQQVADMRTGLRAIWRGAPFLPLEAMQRVAHAATAEEVAVAARYFAAQTLPRRVTVLERARVPRQRAAAWIYTAAAGGGEEPLRERLLESAGDFERHERRDATLVYTAYVPVGSLARGAQIATLGAGQAADACVICHGPALRGVGPVPPLAGRSPSYLLRQLYAFRSAARAAPAALPMQAVTNRLRDSDLLAAAAYAASLPP
jgi:cytochrome c553